MRTYVQYKINRGGVRVSYLQCILIMQNHMHDHTRIIIIITLTCAFVRTSLSVFRNCSETLSNLKREVSYVNYLPLEVCGMIVGWIYAIFLAACYHPQVSLWSYMVYVMD